MVSRCAPPGRPFTRSHLVFLTIKRMLIIVQVCFILRTLVEVYDFTVNGEPTFDTRGLALGYALGLFALVVFQLAAVIPICYEYYRWVCILVVIYIFGFFFAIPIREIFFALLGTLTFIFAVALYSVQLHPREPGMSTISDGKAQS